MTILNKVVLASTCIIINLLPMNAVAQDKSTNQKRQVATQLQSVWGVRDQVKELIETIVSRLPADQKQGFRDYMSKIVDLDALDQVSVDAAVDVFSEEELNAMLAYYSSEHGKSAEGKRKLYNDKIMPQVQALIRAGMVQATVPALPDATGGQSAAGQ